MWRKISPPANLPVYPLSCCYLLVSLAKFCQWKLQKCSNFTLSSLFLAPKIKSYIRSCVYSLHTGASSSTGGLRRTCPPCALFLSPLSFIDELPTLCFLPSGALEMLEMSPPSVTYVPTRHGDAGSGVAWVKKGGGQERCKRPQKVLFSHPCRTCDRRGGGGANQNFWKGTKLFTTKDLVPPLAPPGFLRGDPNNFWDRFFPRNGPLFTF